ncbi:pleckstrin homology-like domain family B member 1 isoform X2 [Centruroides vittatus]|uniref:pleckstrin homology-like domain family B member 1 isoform X2 n=1 Tax=Centruroides vittatus TaxID=120091 RepID=UPI00351004DF
MTLLDEFRSPREQSPDQEGGRDPPPSEVDLQVKQSGKSVRVQTDKPHLVSLGGGRLSTGITIHPLPEGTTYVGRVDAGRPQDIIIQGNGAEREHCVIENTEGIVVLYPLCGSVTVDGIKADSPVRLTQGCMLCFGRSNHFRFNHPQQAKQIKKILPNGDISVVPAVQLRDIGEIQELSSSREGSKKKSQQNMSSGLDRDREVWDSVDFVDKVSKFEYLSHRNPTDDKSSRDSGCSDVSWPTSPCRTGISTPEHSPGCIILQQSHFSSSTTFDSSSSRIALNRENEIEREKRKFLKDLYGGTRTQGMPSQPEVNHLPKDSNIYCQETSGNTENVIDSQKALDGANDVKTSEDLPLVDNNHYRYPSTCAQSPPHQKRIKTNGSLPRHSNHSSMDGIDECARIRPPASRYQFSPISSQMPTAASNHINKDSQLLTHHVTQCEKNMSSVQEKIKELVEIRARCWKAISEYQRNMEELVVQENETLHELNMEHALIAGEELDEQGNQEKEIEELENLYQKKQICEETLNGNDSEKKANGEDCKDTLDEKNVSNLETEINTLKSSICERKGRLKDLMQQQDILVKQLKEERQSLQKQKDQLTHYLQQEMGKLKRIEEELESLNLLNSFDIDDLKVSCLIQEGNKFEREKGIERDAEYLAELLEPDEAQKRTSDLWTGSDGIYEGSSAITSDSDITDCTENGKTRRESLVIANPDDSCIDYDKSQNEDAGERKNRNAQRPLTRYLPVRGGDIDLRRHIESAGHQIVLCHHVDITTSTCKGYLQVLTGRWRSWKKRWVVFDRRQKTLVFYSDRSENKLKDGITFQCIEEVYVDHEHSSRSPNPRSTFCVKTDDQLYYLVAPNSESMRIWVDVIFTGAEGYRHFMPGFDP